MNKTLFYTEMALSLVVAAIALLVQAAERWGGLEWIPAVIWLGIFVHCLFKFRWRGLWFLLGLPVAFVAIAAYLAAAPPVQRRAPAVPQVPADRTK